VSPGRTRLEVYARLAHAETAAEIDDIEDDMQLRFGPPPPEACDLIDTARIGLDCRTLGIARLDVGTDGIAARLRPSASAVPGSRRTDGTRPRLVYKYKIGRGRMLQAAIRFLAALKRNGVPDRNDASRERSRARRAAVREECHDDGCVS